MTFVYVLLRSVCVCFARQPLVCFLEEPNLARSPSLPLAEEDDFPNDDEDDGRKGFVGFFVLSQCMANGWLAVCLEIEHTVRRHITHPPVCVLGYD